VTLNLASNGMYLEGVRSLAEALRGGKNLMAASRGMY
jgi:hypothetical protein